MVKVEVVKIGSNIVNNPEVLKSFLADFSQIPGLKILVHGGGSQASTLAKQMGVPVHMIDGRRVTDKESLDIVTMVYAGLINKQIVAQLQSNLCNALGVSGADANLIVAHKREGAAHDYGYVGDIDWVNVAGLKGLFDAGTVPVFSAITHNGKGQLLNTNADTIAAELAKAIKEHATVNLTYVFEKPGVLSDVNNESSVIPSIDRNLYLELKEKEIIFDGMIPKLDNCFSALEAGVQEITIGGPDVFSIHNETKTKLRWN
ncbi:MAG: acetylglutamate kinase [Flavobacteriaceae bacterium]